ncbi:hypothetical protein AB1N83_010894 [Pleurotus pulmonarius]
MSDNLFPGLGHVFQVLLFGFLAGQISRYHESFPRERIEIKAIVWTVFLLSLALAALDIYELGVTFQEEVVYGSPVVDGLGPGTSAAITLLNGCVMAVSQHFFSWRIRNISQKRWLQIIICVLSILQLAGSIAHSVAISAGEVFQAGLPVSTDYFYSMWIVSNITCDLSITLSMIWFLWKAKGGASFKPTKAMLGKILMFTLETGLITTVCMALQWTFNFLLDPYYVAYFLFFYPSGTLYAIWLLATLNARSSFNKDLPSFIDMSRLPTAAGEMRFKHPMVEGTEIVISITSNVVTGHDGSSDTDGMRSSLSG